MQESTDIIIGYTLTCSTLYVLFTCLAWRIETHGSTCCAALYSKYSITGAYYCRVIAAISVWFGLSVVVTVVLRYIYHTWLNGQFNYFFFTSFMLALLKWGLAILLLLIRGVSLEVGSRIWNLPSAIGATENLDIVLSNLGLMLCDIHLYVVTKNTYLMWVLFWSILFGLEKFKLSLIAILLPFCVCTLLSVWMNSGGGQQWHNTGIIVLLGASCAAGLRWTLIQKLKSVDQVYNDPIYCIYTIGLSSVVLLSPFAVHDLIRMSTDAIELPILELSILFFCGGIVVFGIVLVEIHLCHITSCLTMGVIGGLKEIVTVLISFFVLNETMAIMQWAGVFLGILSFTAYTAYRGVQMAQEEEKSCMELVPQDNGFHPLELDESDEGLMGNVR